MARPFDHLEPGTDEAVWASDPRYRGAPELDTDVDVLIVVAAHPDDETLGATGLMRRVHERGGEVRVIVATDGEGSHPDSPTRTPAELADIRREEVRAALRGIAPDAAVDFWSLPDGGLREEIESLTRALAEVIDGVLNDGADPRRMLAVAPWSGDGHGDHRAAAEALTAVCAPRGIRRAGYPIWLWHWGAPDDVPWPDVTALTLDDRTRERKRRVLALHVSQVQPLSPARGDEAIVHDGMRAHFLRDRELFVSEQPPAASPEQAVTTAGELSAEDPAAEDAAGSTLSADFFDAFYTRNADDPWGFDSRWYEERKRAVLLAALPRKRLGRVLEVGCATGATTRDLAPRSDSLIAMDAAEAALSVARSRVPDAHVRFVRGAVPADWPDGAFDTIVLSEVAYYLSIADLERLLQRIETSLAGDGCLVACHWRHPVPEYPQSGDAVHEALRAHEGWVATVRHEERDFLLDVFERSPARSVAQREGLA